ncbi:outer membrane beta-barrel protein [Helicobacter sp. T3_23-1059]
MATASFFNVLGKSRVSQMLAGQKVARFAKGFSLSLALGIFGFFGNVANAEESGVFAGVEVGYAQSVFENKITASGVGANMAESAKYNGGGVKYGLVVGYKQFFSPYFGLRYYANVSMHHAELKSNAVAKGYEWKNKVNGTMINYGANIDALVNFVANDALDFGAFIGVGVGGATWMGKDLDDHEDYVQSINSQWSLSRTGLDVALNAGLRLTVADKHGFEVVARIPFIKTSLLDESGNGVIRDANGAANNVSAKLINTLSHTYAITARYTFSF